MNTIEDHLRSIAIIAGSLAKQVDRAKLALSQDESIRNHPERRQWEDALTSLTPSLPTILNNLSAIERKISRAHR